jgi:hypothetical protein
MNSLEVEIRHAQDRLNSQLNNISGIRQEVYVNLMYYVIIVASMIFCTYIILADLYRTLKSHNENNKRMKQSAATKEKQFNDDYVYPPPHSYERNITNEIIKNLQETDQGIKSSLSAIKNFNKRHDIDSAFYTKTGVRSLTTDDNYMYEKNVNDNFWSMIFEKPTYHSILNSDPRNYIYF